MKCRSDPQVVVSRTFRIASLGLTIWGSSTVSTRRSLTPFQTSARIASCLRVVGAAMAAGGVVAQGRDLAGLDQRLGPVQHLQQRPTEEQPREAVRRWDVR